VQRGRRRRTRVRQLRGGRRHGVFCVSDADGIDGPVTIGSCDVFTGSIARGPAEVVRALGGDLKPVAPAPAVVIE